MTSLPLAQANLLHRLLFPRRCGKRVSQSWPAGPCSSLAGFPRGPAPDFPLVVFPHRRAAPGPGPASAPHPNPPGVSPPQGPTRMSPWACSAPSLAPQTSQMAEGAGRPSLASPGTMSWAEGASVDLGPWPRLLASLSCLKGCCRAQVVSWWRPGPCGRSGPGNVPSGCRSLRPNSLCSATPREDKEA